MPPYFIDFEAFKYKNNDFIIKELVILDVSRPLTPLYYLFEAPTPWRHLSVDEKIQHRFVTKNIHNLRWSEGDVRYCKECVWHHIKNVFPDCRSALTYVMGPEKMQFLKEEFPELNLVEYNVTFKTLPQIPITIHCLHREHGEHCAYRKTLRLFHHYATLPV